MLSLSPVYMSQRMAPEPSHRSMLGASRGVAAMRGGIAKLRRSRSAVVVLVYAALVLDNMLLTVVGKSSQNPTRFRHLLGL